MPTLKQRVKPRRGLSAVVTAGFLVESIEKELAGKPGWGPSLGNRLQEVRRALGWSRYELSLAVGVSEYTVRSWERDETTPCWFHILLFLAATGVSFELLTKGVCPLINQVRGSRRGLATIPQYNRRPAGIPRMNCPGSGLPAKTGGRCSVCMKRRTLRRDGTCARHPIPRPVEVAAPPEVKAVERGEVL
jgi:transcriptional regulator with XRE-family HTH domain